MKTKYVFHGNQFYKKSIYVCLLRDLGRRKSNREGKTDVLSIRLSQGQMFPYIGVVLNDKFPFYRTKKTKNEELDSIPISRLLSGSSY